MQRSSVVDALAAPWDGQQLRRRPRQPAVPVAARRGHDPRRGEPATVADRTPTPPSSSSPSPSASRGPTVDASASSLPQSILASRDAGPRARGDRPRGRRSRGRGGRRAGLRRPGPRVRARPRASAGADARRRRSRRGPTSSPAGSVSRRIPALRSAGTLGDRARLSANFRDQYYGLVPAVVEGGDGPALVTSGLVDPGRCAWGERPVTFARRRFGRPTVDLARLSAPMRRWAETLLVPKVVVANQTRVIEAVADSGRRVDPRRPAHHGSPDRRRSTCQRLAAVLTSPVRQRVGVAPGGGHWAVGRCDAPRPALARRAALAGGRSRRCRLALAAGDVAGCGDAVMSAYGLDAGDPLVARLGEWWRGWLPA